MTHQHTRALVIVALAIAGPSLAVFLRRRRRDDWDDAPAPRFEGGVFPFREGHIGGATLTGDPGAPGYVELKPVDVTRTHEHVPGCDDDGWDHPGPCVFEVCRECGTPAGEHTAACSSSPEAMSYAASGLVRPTREWPAGIVGEPVDVPVFTEGGIVPRGERITSVVIHADAPPDHLRRFVDRAARDEADYRSMRTRERGR